MIDTLGYYKDWDGEISLGNQLEFHLENQSKDQIILGFRVYNHGLAIEWLKVFYKMFEEGSKLSSNLSVLDTNKIKNFGFEETKPIFVFLENYRCFDDGKEEGCFLESALQYTINYPAILTTPTLRFNVNPINQNLKTASHWNVTKNWNIKNQDKTLQEPLNEVETNNLKNGVVRLAALGYVILNGNFAKFIDVNTNDLKFKQIKFTLSQGPN
jgi:hypothetical protein